MILSDDSFESNGFVKIHFSLKPDQVDFLKGIDPDNSSRALRILIDKYKNQSKTLRWERYMMYFVFVMCLIILVVLLYPVVVI